ncbi:MAG: hypothetical protein AB7F99_16730 [Vicinamibacterales bacterium]
MRTYLVPLLAGLALAVSAFLPWVHVDGETLAGFPGTTALWVIGLGLTSALLAILSLITRRNSRHPLLIVGLVALGITGLSFRLLPRTVEEQALTRSQAIAIVRGTPEAERPEASAAVGLYVGIAASLLIVGFGLTIVIKQVATPYAVDDPNDDV